MKFKKLILRYVVTALVAWPVLAQAELPAVEPPAGSPVWEPKKPVEFIVMARKGSETDLIARKMVAIVSKRRLMKKPLVVFNKPGGSGAQALMYMRRNTGDAHILLLTNNAFYATPLRFPGLGVNIAVFTPIATMAESPLLLWVHTDSGIRHMSKFVTTAHAKAERWLLAGEGRGQAGFIIATLLNDRYKLSMQYVPYRSGKRVAKELAGKYVQSSISSPGEMIPWWHAGVVKPITVFSSERLSRFPRVPTLAELGHDFAYYNLHSVAGTPGMSKAEEIFYRGLFAAVYATSEWQEYMKKQSLGGGFLVGESLRNEWLAMRDQHQALLQDAGLVK